MTNQDQRLLSLLERVIPFRFLDMEQKRGLLPDLEQMRFEPGEVLMEQGDETDTSVYLLEQGSVVVMDRARGNERRVDTIVAGHYVGEWEPLFKVPRSYEVCAEEPVVAYRLSGERFLALISDSHAFAQAMATILRDKIWIFSAFDRFRVELTRGENEGHISIGRLLPLYTALRPALHPLANSEDDIDVGALLYAVRRLPENLGRTFAFLLTDELPAAYRGPEAFFNKVETAARRRDIWEMLPGKNLVLLRNGYSDMLDLISCLCLYAVEARKIRRRLSQAAHVRSMQRYLEGDEAYAGVDDRSLLEELPFTREEREGLLAVWPEGTIQKLYETTLHREMFNIDVRRQTTTYANRRTDLWTAQVSDATKKLLGCQPAELPQNVRVHVVSSNTHSVTNCLNPWFQQNRERIVRWARETEHPLHDEPWERDEDRMYAVARDYFRAYPEEVTASREAERQEGILRLRETASTGIQVQMIDTQALAQYDIDPGVDRSDSGEYRDVILNIDYAFGEQAEHIIRNLLLLFGNRLASVSFFGKAGALVGNRGDILVPTAFIQQSTDQFLPLPMDTNAHVDRLAHRVGDREVHHGPLLTVEGTLLQNRLMLHFYRHLWDCLGMEMEGAHYYKQVLESSQLGVVPENVPLRCFYYVSDLPLEHGEGLSRPLREIEGVPPLYGITRHILSEIFSQE